MNLEKIIDEAYALYMPQDRYEITELAKLVQDQLKKEIDLCMGRDIEVPSPYNILEIGTKFGGTFYIWNKLVQEHGAGMCISVDMSDGGIHGGISDEEMDKRDLWFTERFSDCHFIRRNSHDTLTELDLTILLNPEICFQYGFDYTPSEPNQIDFLFIDGDHTYEGVRQDFQMYSPFVKKGGMIAFHDINDTQRHRDRNVYVGKFWNEIKDNSDFEAVEFNSNLDWAGIGVLKVL